MENYKEVLTYTIGMITKIYLVYGSVLMLAFIVSVIIKNKLNTKKVYRTLLVFFICTLISYAILVIPRLIDLRTDSYVQVKDATLIIDETNTISKSSGSIMFFGYGDVLSTEGDSVDVVGINFFELPSSDPYVKYVGDIVYAKYSRQIIAIENNKIIPRAVD